MSGISPSSKALKYFVLVTSKFRSGISNSSHRLRFGLHVGKKLGNLLPDLFSTAQPTPVKANEADKQVTGIDGDDVVFTLLAYSIDQQGLDIRLQFMQEGIIVDKHLPTVEAE